MLNLMTPYSFIVRNLHLDQILRLIYITIGTSDSGHGGQTEDLDGDEDDGYDEGKHCALPSTFMI